jgi:KUP system potassium uptake protein
MREAFHGPHALALTHGNVLGVLSLIFWSLVLMISGWYLMYVMRCDNRGEGGILALMSLVEPKAQLTGRGRGRWVVLMGLAGAALLYGDGIITPAISVLGAIEGLTVVTPVFEPYVVPLSILVLFAVFWQQRRGTATIGAIFGPVLLLWFIVMAVLGLRGLLRHPGVLAAANPIHAILFFKANPWLAFMSLGVVFLVVTGGEALYADMGHFGRKPIRMAWFAVVLPALLLNYFGQGALLLDNPSAAENPFFLLAPAWSRYPLVVLATFAAAIASQALISGAYSLTRQAVALGYLPRMTINHTSKEEIGQIYVPFVNWALLIMTIFLVVFFKSSSAIAAAYGVAVTTTMVLTTILVYFYARDHWRWTKLSAIAIVAPILVITMAFCGASMMKIPHGGWFALLVGAAIMILMTTWRRGRAILAERLRSRAMPLATFIANIKKEPPTRVPGMAIFMTSALDGVPPALLHNLRHNKVLHEQVVLMTVQTQEVPYVPREERYQVVQVSPGIFTMTVRYGFMDTPNVPAVLLRCDAEHIKFDASEVTYFLGRETVLATSRPGMAIWREKLFSFMSANAQRATTYFQIPSTQVVEIGLQVEL